MGSCRSLAGIVGSNLAEVIDVCFFVSVVCFQVEVTAWGRSLVQRSPTECGVSECDREASIMRRLSFHEKNIRNVHRLSCKVLSIFVRF